MITPEHADSPRQIEQPKPRDLVLFAGAVLTAVASLTYVCYETHHRDHPPAIHQNVPANTVAPDTPNQTPQSDG